MKGFTLIEVMVAVSILAIISLLVWQSTGSTLASQERQERRGELFDASVLSLQMMIKDLESAAVFSKLESLGRSGFGEQRTKTVFIGKDAGDQDSLTFFTFAHTRYLKDSKQSDQAEVTYDLEADPEASGFFLLKKRVASPPDTLPEEGGESSVLLRNVRELNFRYFNLQKGEMVEAWDSSGVDQLNRLPRAVEILLVVQDPEAEDKDEVERFQTTVFLPMAPGPNDF